MLNFIKATTDMNIYGGPFHVITMIHQSMIMFLMWQKWATIKTTYWITNHKWHKRVTQLTNIFYLKKGP